MDMITVTAKTVDEAVTKALIELETTSDKLEYEVVDKGSAGFLGIGAKTAIISAKKKETEAQAYAAVWDLMAKLEKNLPMAFVFYGQDTLLENNKTYDEIGIFLPNSHFLKNLERHVAKAEAILYG